MRRRRPRALPPSPGSRRQASARHLRPFEGRFLQTPPPFSAKKVGGTPAYKLARQQKPVEITPVEVTVREIELRSYADGLAEVRLVCSSGFYVRSLAHDLGQRLGCGAHLEGLRRTRAGELTLDESVPLEAVAVEGVAVAERRLIPLDRLLTHLPAVVVSDLGAKRTSHGVRPRARGRSRRVSCGRRPIK